MVPHADDPLHGSLFAGLHQSLAQEFVNLLLLQVKLC
jgi:hypothetical protein